MTRTLFFFVATAAMLATMTAVLIRIELAYPGVSPLFLDADGNPDGQRFNATSTAHGVFADLCVMLLGTTMTAAARARGARLCTPVIWLGIALSVALIAILALTAIDAGPAAQTGGGWVLYLPLSTAAESSMLGQLMLRLGLDPSLIGHTANLLILPAAGLLTFGAYAMVSTEPHFGVLSVVALPLILLTLTLAAPLLQGYEARYGAMLFYLMVLPLLAYAAIRLIDAAPDWLVVLTLGILATGLAHIAVLAAPASAYIEGTMVEVALTYIFPLGLAFYALPALILYTRRPRLWPGTPWLAGLGLTLGLSLWVVPLVQVGWMGQPKHYVDYPDAFAADNLAATTGMVLFIAGYLALIAALRRLPRGA